MSSQGTKVTSNDAKVEKAGTVTSDSLAGESISQGGSFGANSGAAASSQPSSSTTTNNTDTSGATVLQPARDAASRDSDSASGVPSQQGQGKESGVGPTYSDSTSSGAQSYSSAAGGTGGKPYNTTTGSGANAGTAPSYVHNAGQEGRPHGANISEGGFDSGAPNASFGDSATDIGGKNDPGRAALQDMQRADAASGNDAGNPKDTKITGDTRSGYSALGGDTSA